MGIRATKGNALARYLTGSTGIPFISWDGHDSRVNMPSPYSVDVTTARKLQVWHDNIRSDVPDHMIHASVRYDMMFDSIEQAWVGMNLRSFSTLLATHYDANRDRITSYVEGD